MFILIPVYIYILNFELIIKGFFYFEKENIICICQKVNIQNNKKNTYNILFKIKKMKEMTNDKMTK